MVWQGKSLKQELQRQQRALAAAEEREVTLQKRLADREAVKDEGQVGKHVSFLLGRVVFERTRRACSLHAVVFAENAYFSRYRVPWRHFASLLVPRSWYTYYTACRRFPPHLRYYCFLPRAITV